MRKLTAQFGDLPIEAVTQTDVLAWLAETKDRLALSTRSQRFGLLRRVMAQAVRDKLRDDDPTEGVSLPKLPKARRGRVRYLSEDELARLLEACPEWFAPAVLLAHDSGLRAAEVAELRWLRLDLDVAAPTVTVADVMQIDRTLRDYPKGKDTAVIPLTDRTAEALRLLRSRGRNSRTDFVIRNSADRALRPNDVAQTFDRARRRAKLTTEPVVAFHHLRHMAATNLAEAGAQATTIQAILVCAGDNVGRVGRQGITIPGIHPEKRRTRG